MNKIYSLLALFLLLNMSAFAQNSVPLPPGYTNIQARPVNAIACDTTYSVWVAFGKIGLGKFNRFVWTMYDSLNSALPKNNILSVAHNKAGIWAGTDTGLYNLHGGTWSWYNISNSNIPFNRISKLYSSGGNDLFIISNPGFVYFNGTTFQQYNKSNSGLVDDTVQCIFKSSGGMWWIGTKHGLSSFNGSTWQSYTLSNDFTCSDDILSLTEDKNNVLFVGTNGGGVFLKSGNAFTNFKTYLPGAFDPSQKVRYQFRLSNGNVLVADSAISGGHIVLTNPVSIIEKDYAPFDFSTPFYLYAIDSVNRIYKARTISFLMTFTDDVNFPNTVDSVDLNNESIHPPGYEFLDINEVRCPMSNNNSFFWDQVNNIPRYTVPKSDCISKTALFGSALWIGGLDASNNLHVAAQTYRQSGSDFWPGPLDTLTAALDQTTKANFDSIWKVNRDTLLQFITQYNLGNITNHSYAVPGEILRWPAHGTGSYAKDMAPFVDHNNDGIYNPYDGDYPKMKGDQMLWWIMNDNFNTHTETGGTPLGIEVRSEAYAYDCQSVDDSDEAVNYTTFYHDSIVNRSNNDYHNVYIGIFTDVDLGYNFDDYAGCRIDGDYGFAYNGDSIGDPGINGYGPNPPMISVAILKGPEADASDGIDNNHNGTTDEPGESCMMNHFISYWNDFSVASGNPISAQDYYNYLHSIHIDGTPYTYGDDGYGGNIPTNYMYPGIPYDTGWSELNIGNWAGDRRFVMSAGPFSLKAKESKTLDYAIVFSWFKTAPNGLLTSVAKNDHDVRKVKSWFETQNFPCNHLVAVNEKEKESNGFNIYPNPAQNSFYIEMGNAVSSKLNMELFDMAGRLIKKKTILSNRRTEVGTDGLAQGVYFVKISGEDYSYTKKLMIE